MIIYTVYETRNLINNKVYIGVHETSEPNDEYLGSGVALRKAIRKYGKENFKKTILLECNTSSEAYLKEKELVDRAFIGRPDTYNMKTGGFGGGGMLGKSHSEETKRKMRKSSLGHTYNRGRINGPLSKEHKVKISKTLTGVKRPKKKIVECPHCKKSGGINGMIQWHFDKCKLRP